MEAAPELMLLPLLQEAAVIDLQIDTNAYRC